MSNIDSSIFKLGIQCPVCDSKHDVYALRNIGHNKVKAKCRNCTVEFEAEAKVSILNIENLVIKLGEGLITVDKIMNVVYRPREVEVEADPEDIELAHINAKEISFRIFNQLKDFVKEFKLHGYMKGNPTISFEKDTFENVIYSISFREFKFVFDENGHYHSFYKDNAFMKIDDYRKIKIFKSMKFDKLTDANILDIFEDDTDGTLLDKFKLLM